MNYYQRVREYYNNLSRSYENLYRDEQLRKIRRILRFIPNGKILDVGAGTGIIEEFIDGEIYLLDISEKMLEKARKKFGNKFRYFVCDARSLPFPDEFFDCVLSISLLQDILLEDVPMTLKEMLRVLKRRGIFIITFIAKEEYIDEFSKFKCFFEKIFEDKDHKEYYFVGKKI